MPSIKGTKPKAISNSGWAKHLRLPPTRTRMSRLTASYETRQLTSFCAQTRRTPKKNFRRWTGIALLHKAPCPVALGTTSRARRTQRVHETSRWLSRRDTTAYLSPALSEECQNELD